MKPILDRHYKKVYGWSEQNVCSWGVDTRAVDLVPSEDGVTLDEDGRLCGGDFYKGDWFLTFAAAKRAALALWLDRLTTARQALASIRKERRPHA